jgi:hypothetical protein
MNYVVTEPGLTIFNFAQKISASQYQLAQQVFGSDAFTAVPYTRKQQQAIRANFPSKFKHTFTAKQTSELLQQYV